MCWSANCEGQSVEGDIYCTPCAEHHQKVIAQKLEQQTEVRIECPFCWMFDFDLPGLKAHLGRGQCDGLEQVQQI